METPEELITQFAKQAPGRCHSCQNCQTFELPDEPRHWCRAFGVVLGDQRRRQIRNCPRWKPFSPGAEEKINNLSDPLLRDIVINEDRFLAAVKRTLRSQGLCLRTMLAVAHPGIDPRGQQLDWVDRLELRFPDEPIYDLPQLDHLLRANGYDLLATEINRVIDQHAGNRKENTL